MDKLIPLSGLLGIKNIRLGFSTNGMSVPNERYITGEWDEDLNLVN